MLCKLFLVPTFPEVGVGRDMDIKHKEVVDWLREVYGKEQIPPYEKTERSITILHQLMTASKCSEDNAKILADDYVTKTAEYSAEAKQLKGWLDPVNISLDMLSEEGQTHLTSLAHTAEVLDVQIPTCTNVILAMNEVEINHMQIFNFLLGTRIRIQYKQQR
ncbi:HAUS augmin-like complex subunit 1 [Portunus trituberculatus]|uniref:HAUS augmin-like complex subunit 1 n=1 Tax=Portunus trituberculatus TaxID=210409 RepID=A0A5B7CWD6_PORTR|nr:HAUS augmin-like complex subunit 1 [Portunus trituberculatus]